MSAEPIADDDDDERRDRSAAAAAAREWKRSEADAAVNLPSRPREAPAVPDTDWQDGAACRSASAAEAEAMTGARYQAEGRELAERFCERCPVARACLETAREGHGWGLAGGYVFAHGYLAVERPSGRRPRNLTAVQ